MGLTGNTIKIKGVNKMENKPQHCHQCGREIYFDGICVSCRAENKKNEILALNEDEIAAKIDEIFKEIETAKK